MLQAPPHSLCARYVPAARTLSPIRSMKLLFLTMVTDTLERQAQFLQTVDAGYFVCAH